MKTLFDLVGDFTHKYFQDTIESRPGFPKAEIIRIKILHLHEELAEIEQAIIEHDLAKTFDGLVDLVYVSLGLACMMNLPFNEGFALVHAANMKKIRARTPCQSKRGNLFDVYKPKGWLAPDLKALLDLDTAEERVVDCD